MQGYSGKGVGLNNPNFQWQHDVGPIPQGRWVVGKFFDDLGGKGPVVAYLSPADATETFHRSGFMIHGDNSEHNHSASEGCIILGPGLRRMMADSEDYTLLVIA